MIERRGLWTTPASERQIDISYLLIGLRWLIATFLVLFAARISLRPFSKEVVGWERRFGTLSLI